MAIIGSVWSVTLLASLTGAGMTGSKLSDFCDAVGLGSASHVIGKSFTTTDTGSITGAGVGAGTGIIGITDTIISNSIYAKCVATFGQAGSKLQDFCDAVGLACVSEMAKATLISTHAPVFVGTGVVDVGSLAVDGAGWGSEIQSAASSFVGTSWPDMALALGEGQAEAILSSGTGSVVITGSGGTPVPGVGVGSGVIS